MIKPFLDDNFLLQNSTAEKSYHDFAKDLPIIDYHNHLPPDEIANDKTFSTITEVWLKGDHYKWRAMRANGIDEKFITGNTNDRDKFLKWAETVPYTMRNPLYHWTHLELQRYFGIKKLLDAKSANEIYEQTNAALQQSDFSVKGLLQKMKVEVVCTTDHPTDSLEFHQKEFNSESSLKMLPTFRPDKFVVIDNPDFLVFLEKLEGIIGSDISTFDDLMSALENRIEFFHSLGCQLADHGLSQLFAIDFNGENLDKILQKRKSKQAIKQEESEAFQMAVLHELGKIYHEKKWTMQFHLGAIRNNNSRLLNLVGADVGADSIGDFEQARGLSAFLNRLDTEGKLAKTILYNLNPRDNELFATMMGNFNDGSSAGKIQWGSAWWFLDQKDGMEKQINTLSNMGLLSRFIGMLTDSRSFLSFPRHEYFRRILCNLIGTDVENGELPNEITWLGKTVEDICYNNAKRYFNF
jgi:glucuronate isomerase